MKIKAVTIFFLSVIFLQLPSSGQNNIRQDISLNNDWLTSLSGTNDWKKINIPQNWDDYYGYRRLLHGNLHGDAIYKKTFELKQLKKGKRFFLFFEGVGSYATVSVNKKYAGAHSGGRTSFTLDITDLIKTDGSKNELEVKASHPANIKDLPWVCGGCSDERGFSEGSQPLGIFRPVHLVITNEARIVPFGVHAYASINERTASITINTTVKNYSKNDRNLFVHTQLLDEKGRVVMEDMTGQYFVGPDSLIILQGSNKITNVQLWSPEHPYLYTIVSYLEENNTIIDKIETPFGFRTINWKAASHQFVLNNKPVFINGIAEYEHLLGGSHAFSNEEIIARMKWIRAAGFNAFRDAHQPHNLLYGKSCDEKGILWWTQFSAHVWYDTKEFRENFKTLLSEWVIERRNDPAVILWGLQNESKLPKDFAEECTALIRSLDPTASSQRLVTTCNGGEGTDWDVPQNWTGTYGGDPATYAADIKKQILIGEYGAWRTLDLHTEGGFVQNGALSEDRMTQLMEQKIRLAESVKDSCAGQFFWLLTSHDNPGRVQGGEGQRELDRIGPVNYKGLLTPWEEATDAFYMFRSNYASKEKEPMVYIVSHTWPNRWMKPGIKDSIIVYSNCDEVELLNDIDGSSLGKQKRNGIGTHFQWDKVDIQYNVLYAVGYVDGKAVARDTVVLFHLPSSPNYNKLLVNAQNLTKSQAGNRYVYRINCGGGVYLDENNNEWNPDNTYATSWTASFENMPKIFASQRRIFAPIKNTKDWKLFQSFRYGKDKLRYNFNVDKGTYLVELYFIEPWLGISGINAKGMRLFDVAVNDRIVIRDLDIWNEVGANTVLKKTVVANVTNGKLNISFPKTKVGEAVISAIAIAKQELHEIEAVTYITYDVNYWLDIGDKVFDSGTVTINTLPPNLFGADWVQLHSKNETRPFTYHSNGKNELFICLKDTTEMPLKNLINTNTKIITDENRGTSYFVYKKQFADGDKIAFDIDGSNMIVCMQPVTNMQPAYDLKPTISYRPATARLTGEGLVKSMINEKETISFTKDQTAIEWPVNIGAADIYSLNIRYSNPADKNLSGTLQIIMADGTVMRTEKITFTPTKTGKWNYISANTGSMVNAGNYIVKIIADDAAGVGVSGLDIQ